MAKKFKYDTTRKLVNRFLIWLLRLGRAPKIYYLLTTTGYKSGQPHSIPIVVVDENGQRYLVAAYGVVDWVNNARAAGEVTLSQGASSWRYAIEEIPPELSTIVLKTYINQFTLTAPYFDATPDSLADDFINDAQTKPVFKLTPL